jgi:hypothetical protein
MISIKIYKQGDSVLIGACDEELLGKKFKDGKFQIDVSASFYDGERIAPDALEYFLEDATIANLVGKVTVECAVKLGLIDPACIMKIKGVPHAQMIRLA